MKWLNLTDLCILMIELSNMQNSGKGCTNYTKRDSSYYPSNHGICYLFTSFRRTMYSIPFVSKIGTFEILVYTNRDAEVPLKWEDSDPQFIPNAETVKLRSFSTSVRVDIC